MSYALQVTVWPKSVETNRRPAFPLHAGLQFESASRAPPSVSAAVAHLKRYAQ
jgi:hypothetical protein